MVVGENIRSMGGTRIKSNYQSVNEQSAIRAGDGGFQVSVAGDTTLTGGQITSTEQAVQNGSNRFTTGGTLTTTDLQNSASYQAKSAGIGVGISAGSVSPSGVGLGSDKGSDSSTTTAAISGIAWNTQARTGDAETGIGHIFNKEQVQQEAAAQVAITSEFGKQASKAVGDYAGAKLKGAENNGDQAGIEAWREGGSNRVALHGVVGGLTGGAAGAAGAAAASAAAPAIEQLQGQLQQGLQNAGLGESASKVIASLAGGATAAGIGAAASGGSVAGGATAFNADVNNRQLHPSERRLAKELAAKAKASGLVKADGSAYTAEDIEEQMRLMGNQAFNAAPNTTDVQTTHQGIVNSIAQDPGMPRLTDGRVAVEILGQANMALQQFIIGNSLEGANHIPGQSPYVASNPALNKPVITTGPSQNNLPTARCADGDVVCLSGVGAQQNAPLTQEAREAIANTAASTSRQAGVVAAGATAVAASSSPPIKPIAGSVAVGATVIGVVADGVEQVMRPDMNQVFRDQLLLGVPADVLTQRYPLYAPVINAIKESLP